MHQKIVEHSKKLKRGKKQRKMKKSRIKVGKMQGSTEQRLKMWREHGTRIPPNRASYFVYLNFYHISDFKRLKIGWPFLKGCSIHCQVNTKWQNLRNSRIFKHFILTKITFLTEPIAGYIAFPASSPNSKNTRTLERICLSHLHVLESFSVDLNRTASSALQYEVCIISSLKDCSWLGCIRELSFFTGAPPFAYSQKIWHQRRRVSKNCVHRVIILIHVIVKVKYCLGSCHTKE